MLYRSNARVLVCVTSVLTLFELFLSMPALADEQGISANTRLTTQVTLDIKTQSLSQVLAELSKNTKQSFLVDGKSAVATADIQIKGTLQEALDKIGDTFDYGWKVSKSGIIILHKRFKNPMSAPQTNLLEMRKMADDVLPLLALLPKREAPFEPLKSATYYQAFFDTLTQQQVADMLAGKALYAKTLDDRQLRVLADTIAHVTPPFTTRAWETFADQLSKLPTSSLQVRRIPVPYQRQDEVSTQPGSARPMQIELDLMMPDENGHPITIPLDVQLEKVKQ